MSSGTIFSYAANTELWDIYNGIGGSRGFSFGQILRLRSILLRKGCHVMRETNQAVDKLDFQIKTHEVRLFVEKLHLSYI